MSQFTFEDFVFDSLSYRLTYRGTPLSIRPKAAQLLHFMLLNRNRVVTKAEITAKIWGTEDVRDYALFQLISELRKLPTRGEIVRTQPNAGYQWIVPTRTVRQSPLRPRLAVACLMAGLLISSLPAIWLANSNEASTNTLRLPGLAAFSKGVMALEQGDTANATTWFEFALSENPSSVESALFLADALLQQNRENTATEILEKLLRQPELSAYHAMMASDMMSQIHQRRGEMTDALKYAQNSASAEVQGYCALDIVDQRVKMLQGMVDQNANMSLNIEQDDVRPKNNQVDKRYMDHCDELKAERENDDTSACTPFDQQQLYVYAVSHSGERIT